MTPLGWKSAERLLVSILVLSCGLKEAHGIVWTTADAQGNYHHFELPDDHPALRATGADSLQWSQTEFLLGYERGQQLRMAVRHQLI